jgi:hypothetical protein
MAGLVPAIHVFRSLRLSLRPIRAAGYSEPLIDMHNRMKEALVLLGRLSRPSSPAAGETFGPHDHLNLHGAAGDRTAVAAKPGEMRLSFL